MFWNDNLLCPSLDSFCISSSEGWWPVSRKHGLPCRSKGFQRAAARDCSGRRAGDGTWLKSCSDWPVSCLRRCSSTRCTSNTWGIMKTVVILKLFELIYAVERIQKQGFSDWHVTRGIWHYSVLVVISLSSLWFQSNSTILSSLSRNTWVIYIIYYSSWRGIPNKDNLWQTASWIKENSVVQIYWIISTGKKK